MATTFEFIAYDTAVTVLSGATEMNSLANLNLGGLSGSGGGTILDNTSLKRMYADFELVTGTLGGNGTLGSSFDLYWSTSLDGGTTYDTFPGTGTQAPPAYSKVGSFFLPTAATTYRLHIIRWPLIPAKMKFALFNGSGQALPASGATVSAVTYTLQGV